MWLVLAPGGCWAPERQRDGPCQVTVLSSSMRTEAIFAGDEMPVPTEDQTGALLRHFTDLHDGTHFGARSRSEKEQLFGKAVTLIDPYARRALGEINQDLLLGTGEVVASDVRPDATGGVEAEWTLSWPLQRDAGIAPVILRAHFGSGFHHPHLRSGTAGDWPLNVIDEAQAAAELPTLRAMAAADLHNLVFQLGGDVRIIPAVQVQRTG